MIIFQRNFIMSVPICKKLDIFYISKCVNYLLYILAVSFFSVFHLHLLFLNTFLFSLTYLFFANSHGHHAVRNTDTEVSFAFKFALISKCIMGAFIVPLSQHSMAKAFREPKVKVIFSEKLSQSDDVGVSSHQENSIGRNPIICLINFCYYKSYFIMKHDNACRLEALQLRPLQILQSV